MFKSTAACVPWVASCIDGSLCLRNILLYIYIIYLLISVRISVAKVICFGFLWNNITRRPIHVLCGPCITFNTTDHNFARVILVTNE